MNNFTGCDNLREWRYMEVTVDYCDYPDCTCPLDAGADAEWCAKGLSRKLLDGRNDKANPEVKGRSG